MILSRRFLYLALSSLCALFLSACDEAQTFAPVMEISKSTPIPASGAHRVTQGETLYEIAWQYGLDYRYLATINHVHPPYAIQAGQLIYLRRHPALPITSSTTASPISRSQAPSVPRDFSTPLSEPTHYAKNLSWTWPAKGSVIKGFSLSHKGINIGGTAGEPIVAAAAGNVVYSGNGLRGYGNLIILKHNSLYLSAYAHNRHLYVKEGDWVKKGQKIADMGKTDSEMVMLHFEIRRAGNPMDPLTMFHPQ